MKQQIETKAMHAQQSPNESWRRESSFAFQKFTSPNGRHHKALLPSVTSSPELTPSPAFSEHPSFVTLDQLQHYEDCIAQVSKEVASSRDACIALQERLWLSESDLRKKDAAIDHLLAEKQHLKDVLCEKVAIIEALTFKNIQNQEEAVMKLNEGIATQKATDQRHEQALLEKESRGIVLIAAKQEKETEILRLQAIVAQLKDEISQLQQSVEDKDLAVASFASANELNLSRVSTLELEISKISSAFADKESQLSSARAKIDLQAAQITSLHADLLKSETDLHDQRERSLSTAAKNDQKWSELQDVQALLTGKDSALAIFESALDSDRARIANLNSDLLRSQTCFKEEQKAHLANQLTCQSQKQEILRLQQSLQASESTAKSLQHALQEEQRLTQQSKEDQKALALVQRDSQSQKQEILRLQQSLQASESTAKSLQHALQEEQLLNQKFGKVEHLISANSTVSFAGQAIVVAQLEAEKKLSERLKAALEESSQMNSRVLLANSAYQDKIEDLTARVISCNASEHAGSHVQLLMLR